MQTLSKKKHEALKQLEELSMSEMQKSRLSRHSVPHNDAFLSVENDIQQLEALFARYHVLLAELGDCIQSYHELHRHLRIHVLAPQFRRARSTMDRETLEFHRLLQSFVAVRSY